MLISRTWEAALPPEPFASGSEMTVIVSTPNGSPLCSLLLGPRTALPPRRDSGSHHHLNYFGKQKPVKAPAQGLRHRMGQNCEPRKTSSEKHNFAEEAAHRGASETLRSMLHHGTRDPCHQR